MIFLQTLCKALDVNEWFINQDGKHETIEDFVKAFDKDAPFKGKYLDFCIAGKEYENKNGYTSYDMWLPKAENRKYAYGETGSDKVLTYNEAKHLKKLEVKPVSKFGDDDLSTSSLSSSDFSLD